MRSDITVKTLTVFLLTAGSMFANGASFAGYIQATSVQDFAFLSSNIGDSSFNVTFSSSGTIGFSYFAGSEKETAQINLVDNNIYYDLSAHMVLAGLYNVTDPTDPSFSFGGLLFILPALSYTNLPNKTAQALSEIVPGDAIVNVGSLLPVTAYAGCPYCGTPAPAFVYNDVSTPLFAVTNSSFADVDPWGPETPEPSTAALFGIALLSAAAFRWKRQYFNPKP